MFTAVPRQFAHGLFSLMLFSLVAPVPAQEVAAWLDRFPDDGMPQLLMRSQEPKGRLATYRELAGIGVRAHAPLIGMLRLPDGQVPQDFADAFGDFDGRAGWCLPVLLEVLPRRDAQPVVLELLRRLGAAARPAAQALEELRESPGSTPELRRRVDAALRAIGRPVPKAVPPDVTVGDGPPLAALLAALDAGPRRWPVSQAILERGEDAVLAGLPVLLRLRAADASREEAIALLRTQQWTMRARLSELPLELQTQDPDRQPAVLRQAVLAGLPPSSARNVGNLMATQDEATTRLLILLAAQWVDSPMDRRIAGSYLRSLRARAPDDLIFLTRAVLSAEERAEMIASFRAAMAGDAQAGGPQGMRSVQLRGEELDRVPVELVPLLLRAFDFTHPLQSFAYNSLCNAQPDCIPLLVAAAEDADSSRGRRLYEVIATIRPADPETVKLLCDRAFDRSRPDWSPARSALQKADRQLLVAELLRRLDDPGHPMDLRYHAKGLHDDRIDEKLAAIDRASVEVDPKGMDEGARYALFRQLSQRGRPGFDRMVELLGHPEREVRNHALRTFGSSLFNAPGQVDVLLGLLEDDDAETVHYAALGLGAVTTRKAEVVERLRGVWQDAPETLRENIVRAWGQLGRAAAPAVAPIAPRLQAEAVDARLAAAYALLRIGAEQAAAAQVVRALLADDDPEVRCRTMSWLRFDSSLLPQFAKQIVPQIDHPETSVKLQVLFTLRVMDPDYARGIADKIRALQLTQEPRLRLWVSVVRREKLGDKI